MAQDLLAGDYARAQAGATQLYKAVLAPSRPACPRRPGFAG
jgi:hypothetical protein